MKIGMILINSSGFPPDIRVDKEIEVLVGAGFEISILTNSPNGRYETDKKTRAGVTIIRCPVPRKSVIKRIPSFFSFLSYEWYKPLESFLLSENPDILHVHDFDYLPTVFYVNKKTGFNKRIVADLHENMPAAQVAYRKGKNIIEKTARYILLNYSRWRDKEKEYLPLCDKVITVVPEAQERLINYGIPKEKLVTVSNTEDESTFSDKSHIIDKTIIEKYENRFVLSYIGGIGPHRGIDTVLEAMLQLKDEIPNLLLLLVGARGKEVDSIKRFVKRKELNPWVEIVEWVPFEKVYSYVYASSVCLVPHANLEHTNTTVPHKLFQYLISGKTVLVSDVKPLKRVVGDNHAGYIFEADNSLSFAEKIKEIYANPEEAKEKAQRGRALALGEYSWKNDARNLVQIYSELNKG